MPNIVKMAAESCSGKPMSPTAGIIRGTSRDRYIRVPNSKAFSAGMRLGPIVNVQLQTATSACPTATSAAGSVPTPTVCRRVTTARRRTTPMTTVVASTMRVATKPSAKLSFWRLTTQNNATAVPIRLKRLQGPELPGNNLEVGSGAYNVVWVGQHGGKHEGCRDRGDECD